MRLAEFAKIVMFQSHTLKIPHILDDFHYSIECIISESLDCFLDLREDPGFEEFFL
jgi:hypothetical protein